MKMKSFSRWYKNLNQNNIQKKLNRMAGYDIATYREMTDILNSAKNPMYHSEIAGRVKQMDFDPRTEKDFMDMIEKAKKL